jgi:hypothetical protein
VSEIFHFQTRINPSWLAVVRIEPSFLRLDTPFPLMNLMARQKGVTATVEGNVLRLTIAPGDPPAHWPPRQLDLVTLLQRHADAVSLFEAIRAAPPPSQPQRPSQRRASAGPSKRPRTTMDGPRKASPIVSIPMGPMLATASPEEVWEAIRARGGEPFTIEELQAALGASVGPYVMIWARDGFLTKADRDPNSGAQWRYRLNRDQPSHPPVG